MILFQKSKLKQKMNKLKRKFNQLKFLFTTTYQKIGLLSKDCQRTTSFVTLIREYLLDASLITFVNMLHLYHILNPKM